MSFVARKWATYAFFFIFAEIVKGVIQFLCFDKEVCKFIHEILSLAFPEISATLLIVLGLGSMRMISGVIDHIEKIENNRKILADQDS